jgi:hypothetical protein
MFSANFRDWLSFIDWYDWKSWGPTKISPIVINHAKLTLIVDKSIDKHSFAMSVSKYLNTLGDPDELDLHEMRFIEYLYQFSRATKTKENYNPFVSHSPQVQKAIYTVQGYLECTRSSVISDKDCNELLKTMTQEALKVIPETAACLEDGIRKGQVNQEDMRHMNTELYELFDHVIDPTIKKDNPLAQQVHDGGINFSYPRYPNSGDRIYAC